MERVVEMGDVAVRLEATDARRAGALERVFGRLPEASHAPAVTLRYSREEPPLPERPPDARSAQLQVWFDGVGIVAAERSGMVARVADGEVSIGGASFDPAGAFGRLQLAVLAHALFPLARFLLHAAALEHRGSSWLVLGGSGMGKSSLAFAAHQAGWRVLDDDLSVLRSDPGGGPELAGLGGATMAVPGELVDPTDSPSPGPSDVRGRRQVMRPVSGAGFSPLAGCIVVGHADSTGGSVRQVVPADALAALLIAWPATINPLLLPAFFPLASHLARRPAFRILQGREARGRRDGLQRALAFVARTTPAGSAAVPASHPAIQANR